MSTPEALAVILSKLDGIDNKLSNLEADMDTVKKDIAIIKLCVATENAKDFPPIKNLTPIKPKRTTAR